MFKKFVRKIIEAENQEDAVQNVFYGADGIDMAFQQEKITWADCISIDRFRYIESRANKVMGWA